MLNGLAAARGDLIALLDSDDEYLAGYLDRLRACAKEHADADFFFSRARVFGGKHAAVKATRDSLKRTEYPAGAVGPSRCAALLFGEFIGVPTSGLAFRAELADRMVTIATAVDSTVPLNSRLLRILGVPGSAFGATRVSADGLIVRLASILNARKFCLPEEAFAYRIHGDNAYASLPRRAALYLRLARRYKLAQMAASAAQISSSPSLPEVLEEVQRRARPLRLRRRLTLALFYGLGCFRASGSLLSRAAYSPLVCIAMLRARVPECPPQS